MILDIMYCVYYNVGFTDLILVSRLYMNSSPPSATYMRQQTGWALVEIMACHLIGAKPLFEPMLEYC